MVAGLCVLLVREACVLLASFVQARASSVTVWSVTDQCLPGLLLCLTLSVLISTMAIFAVSEHPWAHASSVSLADRPVYTLRYFEWLFTVPLLLLLAGRCALRRPLQEVLRPITVTEVYMVLAWAAYLAERAPLRWALIAGTFAGYGWASYDMLRWVSDFLSEPSGSTCRRLRASSAAMLVALFGVYGAIYLLAYSGAIGTKLEQIAYTTSGFAAKVVMSVLFTAIRAMEHHQTMSDLLLKISGVSTAFMSLLRGSFDYVVPCTADASGECFLPASSGSGDLAELESCLGRSLSGSSLNQHLAGQAERERFARYVRNTLRQAELSRGRAGDRGSGPGCGMAMWPVLAAGPQGQQQRRPPVAQVLHVKLLQAAGPGGADSTGVVSAVVHLSVAPQPGSGPDAAMQVVAGICVASAPEPAPALLVEQPTMPLSAVEGTGSEVSGTRAPAQKTPSTSAQPASHELLYLLTTPGQSHHGASTSELAETEGCDDVVTDVKKGAHRAKLITKMTSQKGKRGAARQRRSQFAWRLKRKGGGVGAPREGACSLFSSEVDDQSVLGGSDVRSQSSKLSCVGSVTMACRQLLGPLHDRLPPPQLVSKRIEDHVSCAAEMVRLRAPAKIAKLRREQELAAWRERSHGHEVHSLLSRGRAPEGGITEDIWHSHMLPNLEEPPPGRPPEHPAPPEDDELWLQAWKRTYEDWSEEEGEEDGDGDSDASSQE